MNIPKSIKSISSTLLAGEAIKRGIKVDHINKYQKEMAFLELLYKKHKEHIIGQNISKTSSPADYAVKNKALTKSLLSRAKISVAKGRLFYKDRIDEGYKFIEEIGFPIVIKPFDSARGNLVFVGIIDRKESEDAIKKILKKNKYVLIEKEFKGEECRIIASRDKFIAAANRVPANVIGDGVNTIRDLIKTKNEDPSRGGKHSFWEGKALVKIKIDSVIKNNLNKNGLELSSIVPKGERIYLRKNSNLSTGGDSVDITDQVHPELKKIAVKAVRAIPGLAYAGVDMMVSRDISKKPARTSYMIVEMNSSPGIFLHHFPFEGKSRNVAKEVIDILFPETKGKYISK